MPAREFSSALLDTGEQSDPKGKVWQLYPEILPGM
jgi:hypothetical protein